MTPVIKNLGLQPYDKVWQEMKYFTLSRQPETPDEIWLLEHPPVFTQGLNGKPEHILNADQNIPIVQTDRGGQVTYHAPGQLIVYLLIDLKRAGLGVRQFVHDLEDILIQLLGQYQVTAIARADAPGVYVAGRKIASLGLKVRKQCTYHGISLNVDMDLSPFSLVNPCGLAGMQMTQLSEYQSHLTLQKVSADLATKLIQYFSTKNPL